MMRDLPPLRSFDSADICVSPRNLSPKGAEGNVYAVLRFGQLLAAPGDTPAQVVQKQTWAAFSFCVLICSPFAIWAGVTTPNDYLLWHGVAICFVSASMLAYLYTARQMSETFIAVSTVCLLLLVIWYDVAVLPFGRGWYLFLIVFNMLSITGVSEWLLRVAVAMMVLWALITTSELIWRFGMLDMPHMVSYGVRREQCDCAHPPCASNTAMVSFMSGIVPIASFLVNYNVIRGFTRAAQQETERINAIVAVSREMAGHFASFNIRRAQLCLAEHPEIPTALAHSFDEILTNFKAYRPYLPQSLIPDDEGDTVEDECRAGVSGHSAPPDEAMSDVDDNDGWSMHSRVRDRETATVNSEYTVSPAATMDECAESVVSMVSDRSRRGYTRDGHEHHDMHGARSLTTRFLRKERATMLHIGLDVLSYSILGTVFSDTDRFVHAHGECVEVVMTHVRQSRGVLGTFTGDKVFASFNAFRRAVSHASLALTAATKVRLALSTLFLLDIANASAMVVVPPLGASGQAADIAGEIGEYSRRSAQSMSRSVTPSATPTDGLPPAFDRHHPTTCAPLKPPDTFCAVVSASAFVGNLGTGTMLSPSIIGGITRVLDEVAQAGVMLSVGIICNQATFNNVSLAIPLRILPHKVFLSSEPERPLEMSAIEMSLPHAVLYEHVAADAEGGGGRTGDDRDSGSSGAASSEWMYQMEREPGKKWQWYNVAGDIYHKRGRDSLMKHLEGMSEEQLNSPTSTGRHSVQLRMSAMQLVTAIDASQELYFAARQAPVPPTSLGAKLSGVQLEPPPKDEV